MNGDYYQSRGVQEFLPFMNFGAPQQQDQQQPPQVAPEPQTQAQAPQVVPPTAYTSGYLPPQQQPYYQQQPTQNYYQQQQQQPPLPATNAYLSPYGAAVTSYAQPQPQQTYYQQQTTTPAVVPDASATTTARVRQPVFKKFVKSNAPVSANDAGRKSFRLQPIDNAFLTRPKWKFNWNQLWCYEVRTRD